MTLMLNVAGDYLVWDGPEAVTYESTHRLSGQPLDQTRTAASSSIDVLSAVKRRALTAREKSPSLGAYVDFALVWLVPAAVLAPTGFTPKPGDVVVDGDGTRWTVLSHQLGKVKQTWRLTCCDLVLANDLRDTITIERASVSYDAAGVAVKLFPPAAGSVVYSGPARVQLLTEEIADERGLRLFRGKYAVILAREVSLTNEDRINWLGTLFEVRGYRNGERLDELPVIDADLLPS